MGSGDYRLPRQRERLVVADAGDGRRAHADCRSRDEREPHERRPVDLLSTALSAGIAAFSGGGSSAPQAGARGAAAYLTAPHRGGTRSVSVDA